MKRIISVLLIGICLFGGSSFQSSNFEGGQSNTREIDVDSRSQATHKEIDVVPFGEDEILPPMF